MADPTIQADPTFLPSSVTASQVGTWDYEVSTDLMRYCRVTAALYGLPPHQGTEGVPIERMAAAIHPEDRARGRAKRMQLLQHGGVFVYEYRVMPNPGRLRWVLLRGSFEPDRDGRIARGRGIVLDITDLKEDGFADGDMFFMTEAAHGEISALDRATRSVLAARRALGELDPGDGRRLLAAADDLLLRIAQHIAATLVPIQSKRTNH